MGTTSAGLPYPNPQDGVADTADFIQALAQAIDYRLGNRGISVSVQNVTANANGDVVLNFPDLAAVQGVVVQAMTGDYNVMIMLTNLAGTQAAARLYVSQAKGAGFSVNPYVGAVLLMCMAWGVAK